MAFNIITPSNSLTDTQLVDNDGSAFLLVTEGGYITLGLANAPAYYTRGGYGNINVKGSIISQTYDAIYAVASLSDANQVGHNSVTISSTGLVQGNIGVHLYGDYNVVSNAGLINGTGPNNIGIEFNGTGNAVDNSGTIKGVYGVYAYDTLTLRNSGTISSNGASIFAKTAVIFNTGVLAGTVTVSGAAIIENTGLIEGDVRASATIDSNSTVTNSGTITGKYQTSFTLFLVQSDYVYNDGRMGAIELGRGNDNIENHAGATIAGIVHLDDSFPGGVGADDDTLINGGTITGAVFGGDGDDVVDTATGVIVGVVNLGDGADTYTGGDAVDRVIGGLGNDTIDLGDGRDAYRATDGDGNDDVDAGDGIDTYNASDVTTAIAINLGAAITANGVGNDTIAGFENIVGGAASDTLSGDDGANRIDGQDGADVIFGDTGKDRLIGGLGADTITGGVGRDVMTGGKAGSLDSDRFVFAGGDSGTTASTRDVITDFRDHRSNVPASYLSRPDLIDLGVIDANTTAGGDQAFSFNETKGAAFSGVAGSLVWQQFTGFALISGDTNGDGKADFVIQLNGGHVLFTSDFVL